MIVCPTCHRHHQEAACPFCRTARPAGLVAAGLAALALSGCPQAQSPAPVYGAPVAPAPPPRVAPVYGAPPAQGSGSTDAAESAQQPDGAAPGSSASSPGSDAR